MNIIETLRRSILKDGVLKRKELVANLSEEFSESQIDKAIAKLVQEDQIKRSSPGVYVPREDSELEENRILVQNARLTIENQKKKAQIKKTMKFIKKLKKRNTQYIRDRFGSIRKLDKVSSNLNELALLEFVQGDAKSRYDALNASVKLSSKIVPVTISIDDKFKDEFESTLRLIGSKKREIVTTINGTFVKFSRLVLASENE